MAKHIPFKCGYAHTKETWNNRMINIECKIKRTQNEQEILDSRMQLANRLSIVIISQADQTSNHPSMLYMYELNPKCLYANSEEQGAIRIAAYAHFMPLPNSHRHRTIIIVNVFVVVTLSF